MVSAKNNNSVLLRKFFCTEACFVFANDKNQHARIDKSGEHDHTYHHRLEHLQIRGCKKFCVNGHLAGNCLISRRSEDDRSKESSIAGFD